MFNDSVKQRDISANRDNIGRDKNNSDNITFNGPVNIGGENSPIAAWMSALKDEMSNNNQITILIDTLQMYATRESHDGINGLVNKLNHAGRAEDEVKLALRKKELFVRLLAKYSMFESAQEIFAYLLSKVEGDFRSYVLPSLAQKSNAEVDQLFHQYVILPCANEIKSGVFCLNTAIAAGMVYWLAEQCFIRWHA